MISLADSHLVMLHQHFQLNPVNQSDKHSDLRLSRNVRSIITQHKSHEYLKKNIEHFLRLVRGSSEWVCLDDKSYKPRCRDAINFVRTFSTWANKILSVKISTTTPTSDTMSSWLPDTSSLCAWVGRVGMEDMIPVMKASAVLLLESSLQDSAPESETTSDVLEADAENITNIWNWDCLSLLLFTCISNVWCLGLAASPRLSEFIFVFLCIMKLGDDDRCQLGFWKTMINPVFTPAAHNIIAVVKL